MRFITYQYNENKKQINDTNNSLTKKSALDLTLIKNVQSCLHLQPKKNI